MLRYLFFSVSTITILGIYTVSAEANQLEDNDKSVWELTEPMNSGTNFSKLAETRADSEENEDYIVIISPDKLTRVTNFDNLEHPKTFTDQKCLFFCIAAPENFNPEQRLLPPQPIPKPIPKPIPTETPKSLTPAQPGLVLETIQTEFEAHISDFQTNYIIEPNFQFSLPNGQKLNFKTGFNTFAQPNIDMITNIPLKIGWEGKTGKYEIQASAGVDLFNRLPIVPNLNVQIKRPVFINLTPDKKIKSSFFLTGLLEYGAYKPNAKTLENEIKVFHSGLNVYWQITPKTSFFSLYRLGLYNDDNLEHQSYSRLEHKWGQFWLAANLFYLGYDKDRQDTSGYFSPANFLIYSGEIGWGGDIFSFLNCRLNTTLGRQIVNGESSSGNTYQSSCTAKISPDINWNFGYAFSTVRNLDTGSAPFNNQTFTSQLEIRF